jgi:ribA/ribD-fused uncharacterized protein
MKQAKQLGHKAMLQKNRLIIDSKHYTTSNLSSLPRELQPENIATKKVGSDVIGFFTAASPLSNFYATEIKLNSHTFHSVEQCLQYNKAMFAEKPDLGQRILGTKYPNVCKSIGDSIRVNEAEWLSKAKEVVDKACRAKFLINAHARSFLLATEDHTLAEASTDMFWGAGFRLTDQRLADKSAWPGQNTLGKILMSIRDSLQK